MSASQAVLWGALAVFNALLASLVLAPRPRHARHVLAAVLVGANALFGLHQAWFVVAHPAESPGVQALIMALAIPTFVALAVFPVFFPHARLTPARERLVLWAAAGLVILDLAILAVGAYLGDLLFLNSPRDPLFVAFVFAPFAAGLVAGIVLLLNDYLRTEATLPRDQIRFILAAFILKAGSYLVVVSNIAKDIGDPTATEPLLAFSMDLGLVLVAGTAWLAVPIALAANRLRGKAHGRPWSHDVFLLGAAALGVLLTRPGFMLEAEYMLARPLLFTVGILHVQLLGLDIRRHVGRLGATLAAGCLCTLLVVSATAENLGVSPGLAAGIGTVATLLLAGVLGWPIARQLMAPGRAEERNRDLYRQALQAAAAEPAASGSRPQAVLDVLRSRLRIGASEHAWMAAQVQAEYGAAGAPELAGGRLFLGRYEVRSLLGEGGFARAYTAWDKQLSRMVVIKESKGGAAPGRRRVLEEARLLAATPHPHIVTIYDAEAVGDALYLVLEFVPGGSLRDRLGKGPMPWRDAAQVLADVLDGLQAAHSRGVIHRDVKPENILLTDSGKAKLADFGVAQAAAPGGGTQGATSAPGVHPGSLLYMSPEQVRGAKLDARSDLYSAAAVFVEAVAGQPYLDVKGRTDFDARIAILEEPPRLPVKGVPAAVNRLLARALGKEPQERPADAADFRRSLDEALGQERVRRRAGHGPRRKSTDWG